MNKPSSLHHRVAGRLFIAGIAIASAMSAHSLHAEALVTLSAHERSIVFFKTGDRLHFILYAKGELKANLRSEGEGEAQVWSGEVVHTTLDGKTNRHELSYSTEKPDELVLGGRTYSIANSLDESKDPDAKGRGPWLVLTSFGRAVPTGRFFETPIDDELDPKKQFSTAWYFDRDVEEAETYRHNFALDDLEGWTIAWDDQHPISHSDGARVARARIFADGRVIGAEGHLEPLVDHRIAKATVTALVKDLIAMAAERESAPGAVKLTDEQAALIRAFAPQTPLGRGLWDQHQNLVTVCNEGKTYVVHVTHPGRGDLVGDVPLGWKEMHQRLWKALREPMPMESEARASVEAKLDKKIALAVTGEPLVFVLDKLEKEHGVGVTLDLGRIHKKGASLHDKVTVDCRDTPLREVFEKVLTPAGLDFQVVDSGIIIPAKEMESQ